ncbi:MAG: ATPase, T2SS/T4P/T4SS family [Pseudomonadota bacterium]
MNQQQAVRADMPAEDTKANSAEQKPLGQRLIDMGMITEAQLNLALQEKKRNGGFLGEVLVSLGFISQDVLTNNLAMETQTRVVDVLNVVVDTEVLALVPYVTARQLKVMPISLDGDVLTVALADAFNVIAIDSIEKKTGRQVDIVSAAEADILETIERHYAQGSSIDDTVETLLNEGADLDDEGERERSSLPRLVDQIIALGIKTQATDIHIQPEEKMVRVRTRVDGVLRQEVFIPDLLQASLTARIKLMADLDVTEKRVPQDGRIRFLYGRREVDLRVSTLPTNHGESVVMRILESADNRPSFNQLGLGDRERMQIEEVIERPFGMVLVTGPTGSGKTTTLYSALGQIDAIKRSVFTLEDPVEYSMPMVRQTQIKSDIGMTFASGLRALLRQDPDVILVGEIRDQETAQLATRAALTGHLVFSTLHTNNAVGAVSRLVDMGVESYLLPAALTAVIGQRLVRRICSDCKVEVADAERVLADLPVDTERFTGAQLYKGEGCSKCRSTGYSGRQAIYEVLVLDERFHDPIMHGAVASELQRLAEEMGMYSMLQDGLRKACEGTTTVEEVLRVVR